MAATTARSAAPGGRAGTPGATAPGDPPGFCALVARALGCRRCSLMLPGDRGALVVEESVGLPPGLTGTAQVALGAGIAGRVAETDTPLLVNRPAERAGLPAPAGTYAGPAFVCYPLTLPDGTRGVLNVTDRTDGRPFGAADLGLLADLVAFYASTYDAPARRQVLRLRGELRRLRAQAVRAQEEERQRLARELHDDAGHALTAAILRLDMTAQRLVGSGELTDALDDVRAILTDCADHLHDLAFRLRPRLLSDLGLAPALRSLTRRVGASSEVEAAFAAHGPERRLGDETELAAFRIAQEAATNALKHARAARIEVTLRFLEDGIALTVADDGVGLGAAAAGTDGTGRDHHGLRGMRERAELAGGVLEVQARPGGGTLVSARLPDRPG